jgi:hypothetical protein
LIKWHVRRPSDFSLQKASALIKWHVRRPSDFSLHAQDWKKFYLQTAQLFDLKIECQIFKCQNFERDQDFERPRFRKTEILDDLRFRMIEISDDLRFRMIEISKYFKFLKHATP